MRLEWLQYFKNPRILPFFLAIFAVAFAIVYAIYSAIAMDFKIRDYKDNPYAPVALMVKMGEGYNILVIKDIREEVATCYQMKKLIDAKADANIYMKYIAEGLKTPLNQEALVITLNTLQNMDIREVEDVVEKNNHG